MTVDKNILAILLSFALYLIYILAPIIPAMFIYKTFPSDRITASGTFSNFKFNATGAFGGYVITVFLGLGLMSSIHEQIIKSSNPTWTVKAKISVLDIDEKHIENYPFMDSMTVKVFPELVQIKGDTAIIKLPGLKSSWHSTMLEFHLPEHGFSVIDLSRASKSAEIDDYNLTLTLKDEIEIRKNYRENIFNTVGL